MEVSSSEVFLSQDEDPSIKVDVHVSPELHDRRRREENDILCSEDSNDKKCTLESLKEFENPIVEEAQESSQESKNIHVGEAQESSQESKNLHSGEGEEEADDGFKTPTASENKIPAVLKCPPAPKKPKSLPLSKQKCPARRRVLLDLSNEIDSLFPADVLKDLKG